MSVIRIIPIILKSLQDARELIEIGPASSEDVDRRQLSQMKLGRFFVGGGTSIAIVDFTPTREGTRRRLGSF